MPRVMPAASASEESASTVARSAPGGATASGRLRSAGATSCSTVVQKAGGSTKQMDFNGSDLFRYLFGINLAHASGWSS